MNKTIECEVEISLDDFDEDEIVEYLEGEGYVVVPQADYNPHNVPEPHGQIFDKDDMRELLLSVLGLGHYVTNKHILRELEHLLL